MTSRVLRTVFTERVGVPVRPSALYTWYSVADQQGPITPTTQDTADIILEPVKLTGLSIGQGNAHVGSVFD